MTHLAIHRHALIERDSLEIDLGSLLRFDTDAMGDDALFEVCRRNPQLHIERTSTGDLEIMTPAGALSSHRNAEILYALMQWARRDGRGVVFDSSGGFLLGNGAMRSPDAAWVLRSRLDALPAETKERFLPLCPEFVVELRSPSDSLEDLQRKMEEYVSQGARLGWLLDPQAPRVFVYRPEREPERLQSPTELEGGEVLPGFVLDLAPVWAEI